MKKKLSIIIPAYNEAKTIKTIVEKVQEVPLDKEIIIVDDASEDGTTQIIKNLKGDNIKKIFHQKNQGKGAAIRSAIRLVEGDIVIIQDADLEYHPDEYPQLIAPILKDRADVVFGSRFIGAHRCFLFTHYIGNKIVNLIANILYNTNLTDFMTCYKAFKAEIIKNINILSNRFGFEAEITGEVFKRHLRVYEVPISYSGRDYAEGKKIKWTDFFVVVWWLIKTKSKKI
jgi:glycosyltransferase involved in cell wall biosynthesis